MPGCSRFEKQCQTFGVIAFLEVGGGVVIRTLLRHCFSDVTVVPISFYYQRHCLVSLIHIVYTLETQVTPIYIQDQWPNIDWYQFLRIWERLPANMRRVADLVGIEEAFLARAVRGRFLTRTDQQRQSFAVHRRFFAALALQDLVREVPLNVVARRYGANRGMLQSLQGSAATFAGMVTVFCQKLGWTNMELLLSQFQSRLSFGVERELCDLVRISLLNAGRARMLYSAGYHTVASLASAPHPEIENILHNAAPFVSGLKRGQETEAEVRERSEARVIWVAGRKGLTERAAAKLIINEAKQLLQADVAQLGINWRPPETTESNDREGSRGEEIGGVGAGARSSSTRPVDAMLKSGSKGCDKELKTDPDASAAYTGGLRRLDINTDGNADSGQKIHGFERTEKQLAEPWPDKRKDNRRKNAEFVRDSGKSKVHMEARKDFTNIKEKSKLNTGEDADSGQKILGFEWTEKQLAEPCPYKRKDNLRKNAEFVRTLGRSKVHMEAGKDFTNVKEKGKLNNKTTGEASSKVNNKECVTEPEALQLSIQAKKMAQRNPGIVSVEPPEFPIITSLGDESASCSRGKRRSQSAEVCESKEKLKKKNATNTVIPEVPKDSSMCPYMELSGDSKLLGEVQSDSLELYTEPFEGEETTEREKQVNPVGDEIKLMLDSQELAACSLSDTCLVKCDNGIQGLTEHEKDLTKHETNISTTVKPNRSTGDEEQVIIGEYDTQPRCAAAGQTFEFLPSLGLCDLHTSVTRNVDDDVAASDVATNSFSLRLSSSDDFSDLSSLAMSELMEKEAGADTEIPLSLNEEIIGNFKPAGELCKDDEEKSPAKKVPRNDTRNDVASDFFDAPNSEMVISTPPQEKQLCSADFTTKTSATPLTSRKRRSPPRTPYSNTPDEGLSIIDVTGHEQVFSMFLDEWRTQERFSLAVACERTLDNVPRIGGRFTNVPTFERGPRGLQVEGEDQVVVGIAVSWGGKDAYYVSLREHEQSKINRQQDSQVESAVDANLTLAHRLSALKNAFHFLTEKARPMVCFDVKEHFKVG